MAAATIICFSSCGDLSLSAGTQASTSQQAPAGTQAGTSGSVSTPAPGSAEEQLLASAISGNASLNSYEADVDITLTVPKQDLTLSPVYASSAKISAQDMQGENKRFHMNKEWRKSILDKETTVSDIYYENGYFYVSENGESAKIAASEKTEGYDPEAYIEGIIKGIPSELFAGAVISYEGDATIYKIEIKTADFKEIYPELCEKIESFAQNLYNVCNRREETGAVLSASGKANVEYRVENGVLVSHKLSLEGKFADLATADQLRNVKFESNIAYTKTEGASVTTPEGSADYIENSFGMMNHEVAKNAYNSFLFNASTSSFTADIDTEIKMNVLGAVTTLPYSMKFKTETGLLIDGNNMGYGQKKESLDISSNAFGQESKFSVYLDKNTYYITSDTYNSKITEHFYISSPKQFSSFSRIEKMINAQSEAILSAFEYEYIDAETARLTLKDLSEKQQEEFAMCNDEFLSDAYLALTGTTNYDNGKISGEKIEITVENGTISEYAISAVFTIKSVVNGVQAAIPVEIKTSIKISDVGSTTVVLPEGCENFPEA